MQVLPVTGLPVLLAISTLLRMDQKILDSACGTEEALIIPKDRDPVTV
jgi:hypothetical protein